MPVHQDVLNTVQIDIRYFMENNNAANVLHAKATGAITKALLDTLDAAIEGWLTESWAPLVSTAWTANEIVLTGLNSLLDPRVSYPISPVIAGTVVAQPLSANATVAVKEDIGRRGKGVAGRVFWVGLTEDSAAGNFLTTGAAEDILTSLNLLATTVATMAGFEGLCVPHRTVARAHPNPASSDVITGFLLTDLTIDSQKDRLPFHKKRKRYPVA